MTDIPAQVDREIADAMRARNAARLGALRLLKTALVNRAVEKGRDLDEAEARQVIASLVKQRREAIEQFERGGRTDLVARETAEIAVLEAYLPPPVDASELERIVEAAIEETGGSSPRDLGRVMKVAMARLAGRGADGKLVNELARRRLGG